MTYIVYEQVSTRLVTQVMASGEERKYFADKRLAVRAAQALIRQGKYTVNDIAVCDLDYYRANIEKFLEVKNPMTGEMVKESVNTPYGCSVADDAYWQN